MPKTTFRPRAWEDIQESASYLATEAGVMTAERFLYAIQNLASTLVNLPSIGAPCSFSNPRIQGLRRLPISGFENWLVFYQLTEGGVEIVRVLHGARDIARIIDNGH
jgi:toxin ParE1/3/4